MIHSSLKAELHIIKNDDFKLACLQGFDSACSPLTPTIPRETRWHLLAKENLLPPFTNLNKNPIESSASVTTDNFSEFI